ncbi:protein translocase subunit SecF, partial [Streptomyces sp. NPDC055709]
ADLKEREPAMKALKKRVLAKRAAAAARGESARQRDAVPPPHQAQAALAGQRRHGCALGRRR